MTVLGIGIYVISSAGAAAKVVIADTAKVTRDELGPIALNQKYKWFKDCLASLDAKKATISTLDRKTNRVREDYAGVPRNEWKNADLISLNMWELEKDGMIASYNGLAAEYNAAMAKFHTAFVNAGKLPGGGVEGELPREVREYMRGS